MKSGTPLAAFFDIDKPTISSLKLQLAYGKLILGGYY
jgi:hypothetical protein